MTHGEVRLASVLDCREYIDDAGDSDKGEYAFDGVARLLEYNESPPGTRMELGTDLGKEITNTTDEGTDDVQDVAHE